MPALPAASTPEVLKPVRRQLGVAHRVLDVLVPEPCLQRPGVVAGVGQRVAAAMPQHVRMEWRAGEHGGTSPVTRLSRGSRFRYPAMCSRPVRDRMHFRQWKLREFMASVPKPIRFPIAMPAPRRML